MRQAPGRKGHRGRQGDGADGPGDHRQPEKPQGSADDPGSSGQVGRIRVILQTANERLAFAQARGCVFARCRKKRVLGGPPCAKLYGGIALDFSLFLEIKK